MHWFKSSKKQKIQLLNNELDRLGKKVYLVEQGLYSAQNQLNQLYRVLWDYSHIVITHSEEEKNGLIQTGFVVIGQYVYDCFESSASGLTINQRTYYILKQRKESNDKI